MSSKSPSPHPVYCVRARSPNAWECDRLQVSQAREPELQPCTSYYCGQPAVSASSHADDTPLSAATCTKNHTHASRGTHTSRTACCNVAVGSKISSDGDADLHHEREKSWKSLNWCIAGAPAPLVPFPSWPSAQLSYGFKRKY